MKNKFEKLTEEWNTLIRAEHHKDADCHFFVSRIVDAFSYGKHQSVSSWSMTHHGYILGDVTIVAGDEETLHSKSCEWLEQVIEQQRNITTTNDEIW